METDYKKLTLAIAGGMIIASAVKAATVATTSSITLWWAKRKFEKEMEKSFEKIEE